NWRFGERQQHGFFYWIRGALAGRVKLADRFDVLTKELDAHRTVHLRRIDIQDSTAENELSWHLDHIHGGRTNVIEVLNQQLYVNRLAKTDDPGQIGIERNRTHTHGRAASWNDGNCGHTGRNLPERRRSHLLDFRMRGETLKRQYVKTRQLD